MKQKKLNECVVAGKITKTGCFLGKNRDRSYSPNLEVIHGLYPNFEYVMIHDKDTGYMEGVNASSGIAILNSALLNSIDFGKNPSPEGAHIAMALLKSRTVDEALKSLIKKYPVYGCTVLATKDTITILESTKEEYKIKRYSKCDDYIVRTNHGVLMPHYGFQPADTIDYLSSVTRMANGEIVMEDVDDLDHMLSAFSYPTFGEMQRVNMVRNSDFMSTTGQIGIDLDNKIFIVKNMPGKQNFGGVKIIGDRNQKPIYKIVIEDIEPPLKTPFTTWGMM